MLHADQKVVCVDNDGAPELKLNGVYTVRKVRSKSLGIYRGTLLLCTGVILREVQPGAPYDDFLGDRFRPLTEPKTSTNFTTGAPRDSRKWDNRRKVRAPA